jgi:hypothetical protein
LKPNYLNKSILKPLAEFGMKKTFIVISIVFLMLINLATLTMAADTDSLVVDTNGNVGIGTATPAGKLECYRRHSGG